MTDRFRHENTCSLNPPDISDADILDAMKDIEGYLDITPGGATSLIAVIGSQKIHSLGFFHVVMPVGLGALIMLVVALLVNNIPEKRRYPEFWF